MLGKLVILSSIYLVSLYLRRSLCPSCNGDHALHCTNAVGFKFRHDLVRYAFADICHKAEVAARKEVSLGFLSDNYTALLPSDILVYNLENRKDTYFDVTGVSPFTDSSPFTPGRAITNAILRKRKKYIDKYTAHGYGFGPFGILAFITLGDLREDVITFLKRLKN